MGSMRAALLLGMLGAAVTTAALALSGCTVEAEPPVVGGYATVYAAGIPRDICVNAAPPAHDDGRPPPAERVR